VDQISTAEPKWTETVIGPKFPGYKVYFTDDGL